MLAWIRVFFSLLRMGAAGLLVWLCWESLPAVEARKLLHAMPDYDYVVEADRLRSEERYSEALIVLDAGEEAASSPAQLDTYAKMREETEAERDDWSRRLADVGHGALTGRGSSVESLAGAVAADLFVFGDVRDLVIEGGKTLRGEDNDEVIVALSAAGIVLTAAPEIDLGAALVKFARRAGALTEAFAARIVRMARGAVEEKNAAPLVETMEDVAALGRNARPAGALTILRHIDNPEELKLAAKFAARADGRFALLVGERPAIDLLGSGPYGVDLLLQAARKGRAGVEFAGRNARLLLAPHPLMGLFKGLYKGNVPALVEKLLVWYAPAVLGVFAAWLVYEALLLMVRLRAVVRRAA